MNITEESIRYQQLNLTEEELYIRNNRHFEDARRTENYLCKCVREGDVDGLSVLLSHGNNSEGNYSHNILGKNKTQFIITSTLVSRAATDGGLPVEISYSLCDIYLLRLEQLTDPEQIFNFLCNFVWDFTTRVCEHKLSKENTSSLSPIVRKAQSMINAMLNMPLSISSIAKELTISPDYLSKIYLKETGERLLHYIKRMRVEEACRYLSNTDYSLSQISYLLGFSSQSQFNRLFYEIKNCPPGKYRTMLLSEKKQEMFH